MNRNASRKEVAIRIYPEEFYLLKLSAIRENKTIHKKIDQYIKEGLRIEGYYELIDKQGLHKMDW